MNFFKNLVDTASTLSSNRFAFLFTTIISNVLLWGSWAGICIYYGKIFDIPTGVYVTYGLANGIVGLGKLGQNVTDNQKSPQPTAQGG
jgi:hypothetical protein